LATSFANTYTTWALDLRNHGRSPHSDEFDYNIMAADLNDFMQQHGIQEAYIIGHSMGGKAAMQFSFGYPEKVLKLVVADIANKEYGASHNELIDAMKGLDLSKIYKRSEAEEALSANIPELGTRQFLLKNLARENDGFHWKMNLEGIIKNYDKLMDAVDKDAVFNKPALFIRGGKSNYIQPEDEIEIKRQFPDSEIITLDNAGHWVHAEAPKEFLDSVLTFLARV
jgi:esterase